MGSATAWHLARRGRQVTLIERFGARHTWGASHGRSRNFNLTYVDPTYQAMLREAAVLWRELEAESGVSLLDLVGIANHGAGIAPDLDEALGALGVRASMLTPQEAQERWAGIRFDTRVVHTPEAGRLDADEAVAALQSEAARHGGEVLLDTRVDSIRVRSDDRVEVSTQEEVYVADTVVVTVGRVDRQAAGREPRAAEAGGHPGAAGPLRGRRTPRPSGRASTTCPSRATPATTTGTRRSTARSRPVRASKPGGTASGRSRTRTSAPSNPSRCSSPRSSGTPASGSPESTPMR